MQAVICYRQRECDNPQTFQDEVISPITFSTPHSVNASEIILGRRKSARLKELIPAFEWPKPLDEER